MIFAKTNGKEFIVTLDDGRISTNGELMDLDIAELGNGLYHIIHLNQNFTVEIVGTDSVKKTVKVKLNGSTFIVEVKDKLDLLLEKMGMSNATAPKVATVMAPMPGMIIDLKVKVGDEIKSGDQLLVLEAMKMENVIKSVGDGKISSIKVSKGDRVEKGQPLMEF